MTCKMMHDHENKAFTIMLTCINVLFGDNVIDVSDYTWVSSVSHWDKQESTAPLSMHCSDKGKTKSYTHNCATAGVAALDKCLWQSFNTVLRNQRTNENNCPLVKSVMQWGCIVCRISAKCILPLFCSGCKYFPLQKQQPLESLEAIGLSARNLG